MNDGLRTKDIVSKGKKEVTTFRWVMQLYQTKLISENEICNYWCYGNVGRKTIDILEKSKLDIEQLYLVASKNSSEKIKFKA